MDLKDKLSDLENFGINLKLTDYDAQAFYTEYLRLWLIDSRGWDTIIVDETEFIVEKNMRNVVSIFIEDGILRFKLPAEDVYNVVMDVLDFVAKNHKSVINIYDYLMENDISAFEWFNLEADDIYRIMKKQTDKPVESDSYEESSEEEEESDSEWL